MDVMLAPHRSARTGYRHAPDGIRDGVSAGLLAAGLGLGFLLFAMAAGGVFGQVPAWSAPWIPTFGVDLSFRLDGLSVLFGLMITGVGALVAIFAAAYMRGAPMTGRFHLTIGLFALAMVGLVTADDVITLFVFWEITSLTSFLLVGTDPRSEKTRKAALQALLVTVGGGLALLAGLILLSSAAGSTSLSGPTIAVAVGVNAIMVAIAAMVAWHPFAGALVDTPKTPEEAPLPRLSTKRSATPSLVLRRPIESAVRAPIRSARFSVWSRPSDWPRAKPDTRRSRLDGAGSIAAAKPPASTSTARTPPTRRASAPHR